LKRNLNFNNFVSVQFIMLLLFTIFVSGCAGPTTVSDLVPKYFNSDLPIQKVDGSVSVRTSVPKGTTTPTFKSMYVNDWIDSNKLKQAVEKSVLQYGVFTDVRQGQSDYVLEIWVDKIQNMLEVVGEGFIFDFTSVWRLTKTKDSRVIVCEFVKGHGAARGFADRAYPPSISAATQSMLQKGLYAVSDQSQSHLSALSTAEHRTPITPVN